MPLQATSGAASYDAFGGGVAAVPNYIEECFSTTLYTGNGSTNTINNGIDVSGEGGLVWVKARANGNRSHTLFDSATYTTGQYYLATNITNGFLDTGVAGTFALNNSGFSVSGTSAQWNASGESFVSWTFRKQPKFFDVVTYTGDGTTTQTINHNLGCQPGFILLKATSSSGSWFVLARSDATNYKYLFLNSTNGSGGNYAQTSCASDTQINLGYIANNIDSFFNLNGTQYVAYLFAHDAGGFGLTGTDNVISCGSYTGNGTSVGPTVTLGWEPQWLLIKRASGGTENWYIFDNMRGMPVGSADKYLMPDNSSEEFSFDGVTPTATGFNAASSFAATNASGSTYIYIAIRRGPMKVPTSGTSVFVPTIYYGNDVVGRQISTGSLAYTDTVILKRPQGNAGHYVFNRLTGDDYNWRTNSGDNAFNEPLWFYYDTMNGFKVGDTAAVNDTGDIYRALCFKRAPNFYDVIRYVGNGSARSLTHNLSAVPELVIIKSISGATNPIVYHSAVGNQKYLQLNEVATPSASSSYWNNQTPTDTTLFLGSSGAINGSSETYETHLFSTLAGVSKVGSYTGNGTSQTINCGFTGGARFVMIKAVGGTGNWLIADSASGITAGNDPYLKLNTINTEVTNEDWLDTDSTGFVVNEVAVSYANTSGIDYIFYAVA